MNNLDMTSETVGKSLLKELIQEISLLPEVWSALSKDKQDDIIGRIRENVKENVRKAVFEIKSQGSATIVGEVVKVEIQDGVKAVIRFGKNALNLNELYGCAGLAVMVVIANPEQHLDGIDDIEGQDDQLYLPVDGVDEQTVDGEQS